MNWNGVTGVLAIIMIFGMPVFIVGIIFFFVTRANADKQKTLRMAIERSDTLSPEVMNALQSMQKKPKTPMNDVRAGLILIAIAAGLIIWRYLDHGEIGGGLAGIAAVPGMIGVALLILGIIGLNRKA
jgi:ACR3 family arsenite efflux pump ArsB